MQQFLAAALLFTGGALVAGAPPQVVVRKDGTETPVLRLKVIPSKETYAVKESVLTKTIFTNVSDRTLCFPKPEQKIEDPQQGYVTFQVVGPPGAPEIGYFLEHIDGGGIWPPGRIPLEIRQKWIKLPPNEEYTTEPAGIPVAPNIPGKWQLTGTYLPPQGSFGGAAYRNELKSAAKSVGCTLPVTEVSAETITINIVAQPEKK